MCARNRASAAATWARTPPASESISARPSGGCPVPEIGPPCPACESASSIRFSEAGGRRYWRCPVCLATFLDPDQRPDPDAERREYDLHRNRPDDPAYRRFYRPLLERLLPKLDAGACGLDYGCGPAPALPPMLREAGFEVATWDPIYDVRPDVLERRYDFITCTEVIEHLHRPADTFRRLHRLLEPGGWLGLMTRFQTDDDRFANWHYRRDPTHVVFYREETLEHVAGRLGWEIETRPPNVAILGKPD